MKAVLKILHLEDLPDDAELVARELKKAGIIYETILADSKIEFIDALKEYSPDIILSDHSLPAFDSHEALKIVKELGIRVPFILVTATVSEEYAVNIMKEGASDYILKDRLQRLPNAILRALEKYNLENQRRLADENLQASERKYKLLFESNPMPMWMISKSTLRIIAVNEAAISHYGYSREEFLKLSSTDLRPIEDIEKYLVYVSKETAGSNKRGVWRHKKKDGTIIMVDIIAHDVMYENISARLILANDVTEKLETEAALANQHLLQQKLITETSIQVQEREREEIGKELHDNINQILASSKLYLGHAIKKENLHSDLLQSSLDQIDLAIEEIRKLSHTLVAPSLSSITLIESIKELVEEIRLVTPLQLTFTTGNFNEEVLNKNIKLMFYRIVQEQLHNILKHAHAKNAGIELSTTAHRFLLIIKDDGTGFDSNKKEEGIGLRNIRNRVEFYDGSIRIISAPGMGCTLEVSVPVK